MIGFCVFTSFASRNLTSDWLGEILQFAVGSSSLVPFTVRLYFHLFVFSLGPKAMLKFSAV